MAQEWFFHMEGDAVEMVSRAVGAGAVGDAFDRLVPDSKIVYPKGLTYKALAEARSGILVIESDEVFKIISGSDDA